jgi:hypothetical protein
MIRIEEITNLRVGSLMFLAQNMIVLKKITTHAMVFLTSMRSTARRNGMIDPVRHITVDLEVSGRHDMQRIVDSKSGNNSTLFRTTGQRVAWMASLQHQ